MDEHKEKLRLGKAVNGTAEFEIVRYPFEANTVALRGKNGCFIGFDHEGILVPCVTDKESHLVRIHMIVFRN